MLEQFIGQRIKMSLHTYHGFRTVVGIVINIQDNFVELDTYKGIEYFSLQYVVSIAVANDGDES
jgi:hypothetical protein